MTTASENGNASTTSASELKKTFDQFDRDHDGALSPVDCKDALTATFRRDFSLSEIMYMMAVRDIEKKDRISFDDFKGLVESEDDDPEKELRDVFKSLDEDGNEALSCQELLIGLEKLGVTMTLDELKVALDGFSLTEKGEIGFEAFQALVSSRT